MMDEYLTHVDDEGSARMVDVSEKQVTWRSAVASGTVQMQSETLRLIRENAIKKGDVLATARIAGILAAKKTHDLIPLCHPLPLTHVSVDFRLHEEIPGVEIRAEVKTAAQTGVEMEALTAVSVAALTIYDMIKAVEKGAVISEIRLIEKTGGKSGIYRYSE